MLTGPASQPGRPVLTPEIQLLYKSHQPRPKDQADFEALSDELTDDQRRWLLDALLLTQPNHPWIHRLAVARARSGIGLLAGDRLTGRP